MYENIGGKISALDDGLSFPRITRISQMMQMKLNLRSDRIVRVCVILFLWKRDRVPIAIGMNWGPLQIIQNKKAQH